MTVKTIEIIKPFSRFDAEELGPRLHALASAGVDSLIRRDLINELRNYACCTECASDSVRKQQTSKLAGHFALIDRRGDPAGFGTVDYSRTLFKLTLPVSPVIASYSSLLMKYYSKTGPQIKAWAAGEEADSNNMLADAYTELRMEASVSAKNTWTIESIDSPPAVHDAIERAGMLAVAEALFDDGMLYRRPPSRLYVAADSPVQLSDLK